VKLRGALDVIDMENPLNLGPKLFLAMSRSAPATNLTTDSGGLNFLFQLRDVQVSDRRHYPDAM
jgi:hypothetical protein